MSNYNEFKSTKIRGELSVSDHPTDNTKLANAIFDRDITVSGNIINSNLDNKLNQCVKTGDFPTTINLYGTINTYSIFGFRKNGDFLSQF